MDLAPVMSGNGVAGGLAPPGTLILLLFSCLCSIPLSLVQNHHGAFKVRKEAVPGGDMIWCSTRVFSEGVGEGNRKWSGTLEEMEKGREQRAVNVGRSLERGQHRRRVRPPCDPHHCSVDDPKRPSLQERVLFCASCLYLCGKMLSHALSRARHSVAPHGFAPLLSHVAAPGVAGSRGTGEGPTVNRRAPRAPHCPRHNLGASLGPGPRQGDAGRGAWAK